MYENPLLIECWLFALSQCSGRHWNILSACFDDNFSRLLRTCHVLARA
jgi:hypothetical protein